MANERFGSGAEAMTKAAQGLKSLMPSLKNHNAHMQELIAQAKESLKLPYERRIKKFRSLILNYAQYLSPIGTDHDRIIPEIEKQIYSAINNIRATLNETESIEEDERQMLLQSTSLLYKELQESRTNIDFFRGTIARLPQVPGIEKAIAIRDRVSQSITKAVKMIQDLEKELLLLRDSILNHK